ncbi:MAG: helix-turn-helix transcriptional regulator [Clostridia bacterium]|nr:helix-turn-helix transcriptional regulator [Clostridia bacterium]
MKKTHYKFERYRDPKFPVYSSLQSNQYQLVSPHFHEDIELLAVISGSITLSIGVDRHILQHGDIAILPPAVIHSATSETEDAAIRGLVFNLKELQLPNIVNELRFVSPNGVILKSTNQETHLVESELFNSVKIYESESDGRILKLYGAIMSLLGVLCNLNILTAQADKKRSRIDPALQYIKENYMHGISVCDIARTVNLCNDRFIRIFKEITAKPPTDYLIDFRLTKAMKLLVSSDMSVAEIGEAVGFSTAGYFCRTFKARIGQTPSQYRFKHLNP